jgi:hypothetical protein
VFSPRLACVALLRVVVDIQRSGLVPADRNVANDYLLTGGVADGYGYGCNAKAAKASTARPVSLSRLVSVAFFNYDGLRRPDLLKSWIHQLHQERAVFLGLRTGACRASKTEYEQ